MLVELAGWFGAPDLLRGGVLVESICVASSPVMVLLLVVTSTLAVFYGRSLCSLVASAPVVAWLLSKSSRDADDSETTTTTKKKVDEPRGQVRDCRIAMDDAAARRLSRDQFYRNHQEFDHNSHPQHSDKAKGLNVTEMFVRNSRGTEIFVKSWVPAEVQLHGLIFLCHGYGDSVTYFAEGVARTLAVAGYAVYGMDYPGFGMSEGLHAHIPSFDRLVDDVIEQYRIIKDRAELRGLPCFLFGESMGGAVALKAHLKEPSMWDGAVLVAPMCKIGEAMYPPWYLMQIMIALAHVIPRAKLVPHQSIAAIGFRDAERKKHANLNPVAYIENPRLGTALQMLRATDEIESKLHEVSLPMLIVHGAGDQVTESSVSKLLHEKAKATDKTLRLYEEAWHCILQGEPDDMVYIVLKDIISWLDARAAPKAGFVPLSGREFEDRVAAAIPSLIKFGRFNVATQTS